MIIVETLGRKKKKAGVRFVTLYGSGKDSVSRKFGRDEMLVIT